MKARRWWQRRCPYRWYDLKEDGETNYWHEHYCRLEGSGEPHTHICDCGQINRPNLTNTPHSVTGLPEGYEPPSASLSPPPASGCQPIEEDDASGDWGYLCRRQDLAEGNP